MRWNLTDEEPEQNEGFVAYCFRRFVGHVLTTASGSERLLFDIDRDP